jgi:N-acetylmuramoyl-L-alanine amidase
VALLHGAAVGAEPHGRSAETLQISSDLRIVVAQGRDVELAVRVALGEGYASIARRVSGGAARAEAIGERDASRALHPGDWVQVPLDLLSDGYRSLVLRNLFPQDGHEGEDWIHVARSGPLPIYDEGLWQVAEWFGRGGSTFEVLMHANGLSSPELRAGQRVRVPAGHLHPAFEARPRSADGSLHFDSDAEGPYAVYRLRPGEALYSAVVVNFTGRTGAEDVGAIAARLAERSGIRDPRDIPVGFEVKIPLDLLEPLHLPADHPRRLEAEARREELDRALESQPVAGTRGGLEGVVVILDPGHGGRDLGTQHNGIWEHDYVYDVSCRLKRLLESGTAARVWMTLEDRETGCEPSAGDALIANLQGTILTRPAFLAREEGEANIGVNLRWYLANSIYRRSLAEGIRSDRVVFLSLHADARHPGLTGAMVYVPGADYRSKTYGSTSGTYAKYEEVKEQPTIRFPREDRVRSEAVSRKLAGAIVDALRAERLPVQPYQPVRDKVIRGRSKWVPAVLRGNAVPAKVLVEMLNISNADDARLLASAAERERLARGLLHALYGHFGEQPADLAVATAAP